MAALRLPLSNGEVSVRQEMMKQNILTPLVLSVLVVLAYADRPERQSVTVRAKVVRYVRDAYHLDTDLMPFDFDITTMVIRQPSNHVNRTIELHHQRVAPFTNANVVVEFSIVSSALAAALAGTNQLVHIGEEHIINKGQIVEQDAAHIFQKPRAVPENGER